MVVGTHSLSRDLDFKNLGLLIIDEEQRFGVVQKEKLKQLRTQTTLSATPIPRTAYEPQRRARQRHHYPREAAPVHRALRI